MDFETIYCSFSCKRKSETEKAESDEGENESVDKNETETNKSETETRAKKQKVNGSVEDTNSDKILDESGDGVKLNAQENSDPSDYAPSNDPSDSDSDSLSS